MSRKPKRYRRSAQRLWFRGGITATAESWRGVLCSIYVENGDFSGTLDVSTFLSSFLAFFTAFFSFFASFRSPFVFLDIRCGPPLAVMAAWTFRHASQVSLSSLRHRLRSIASRQNASATLPAAVGPASAGGTRLIHEIKHDGFRILARRRGRSIRLLTRNGHDFADRFPFVEAAIEALPIRSCVIDGEAIVCDDSGLAVFDLIRRHGEQCPRHSLCVRSA